jgi:hypothetical protein
LELELLLVFGLAVGVDLLLLTEGFRTELFCGLEVLDREGDCFTRGAELFFTSFLPEGALRLRFTPEFLFGVVVRIVDRCFSVRFTELRDRCSVR